jgi:LuxR family maltose regulon positive regulatory protein
MEKVPLTTGAVCNGCLVYEQQGQNVVVLIDTPSWYAWLETATTFSFTCDEGIFTAHKAPAGNRRGGWYWRAYRRRRGRLSRCYLGVSTNLTLANLQEAAGRLARDAEGTPPPAPVPLASHRRTASVILQSSITPPRLPVQHVARPRLLALLERERLRPVIVVSAPAGSGKTILLAEWAATTTRPVAWLSCEEGENDPVRFLSSLTAALARVDARLDSGAQTERPWHSHEHEQVLTGLLNDLERVLQHDMALILDDVHTLTTQASQALLLFLLNHLPSRLHLLIGTRVDPPGLARLRVCNQVAELRSQELGFLSAEVEVFAQAMGLLLDSEAIRLLAERTEGWIAGIQLLTLALRGHNDAREVLRETGMAPRFLLDYVHDEILFQQPPEMQRFLLQTSVLERLTGPLCESVTAESGGQQKLASLLQANLFVSALDDTDTWYRYHPLFAETLRTLLLQQEPALVPELYRRASRWYEQHGWAEDAYEYAYRASDLPHAARLLAELVPSLVEQGKLVRLGHWLDRLPQEIIAASVYLSLALIWTRPLRTSQPPDLEEVIKHLTALLKTHAKDDPEVQAELQRELTLQQATRALARGDIPQALSRAAEMTRSLTGPETPWSRFTLWRQRVLLGAAYHVGGDLLASEQTLRQALPEGSPGPNFVVIASLDELYEELGRLRELGRLYEDLFRALAWRHHLPSLALALAHQRYGVLLYEWNRLQEAESEATQSLKLVPHLDFARPGPWLTLLGLGVLVRVALAQGNSERARQLLENEAFDVARFPVPQASKDVLILLPIRLALRCGQLDPALQWASTCGLHSDDPLTIPLGKGRYAGYVTLARVLIARGRGHPHALALSQAQLLLDHLLEISVGTGAHGRLIEIQMLRALALHAQGTTRQALVTLGPVLAQAEPEGYLRLFADEGEALGHLLARMAPYTTASPDYLERILAAIAPGRQDRPAAPTKSVSLPSLFEPLSAREREVLQLVAEGLSNQQIAQRLVLSLYTVKLHVRHLLRKLGATNRTQAVVRARTLQILSPF